MGGRSSVLVLAGVLLCAWCGWVSGFHTDTWAALVTWLVAFGAVVGIDLSFRRGRRGGSMGWQLAPAHDPWPRPGRGGGRLALEGVWPWLALIVVAVAWDGLGIDTGTHEAHLTLSALAQTYRPMTAALLLAWILVGAGYGAARARAPVGPPDPTEMEGHGGAALLGAGMVPATVHAAGPALLLPSSRPVGVVFWVAVPVVAVLIDLVARRTDGRMARADEFVRFISTAPAANVALMLAWAFAGYHLFAR
jgi:hypothetical protein